MTHLQVEKIVYIDRPVEKIVYVYKTPVNQNNQSKENHDNEDDKSHGEDSQDDGNFTTADFMQPYVPWIERN